MNEREARAAELRPWDCKDESLGHAWEATTLGIQCKQCDTFQCPCGCMSPVHPGEEFCWTRSTELYADEAALAMDSKDWKGHYRQMGYLLAIMPPITNIAEVH